MAIFGILRSGRMAAGSTWILGDSELFDQHTAPQCSTGIIDCNTCILAYAALLPMGQSYVRQQQVPPQRNSTHLNTVCAQWGLCDRQR